MPYSTKITHEVTGGNRALELWLEGLQTYVNSTLQGDTGVQGDTGETGDTGVQGDTGAA